jgi:hypothetical protein
MLASLVSEPSVLLTVSRAMLALSVTREPLLMLVLSAMLAPSVTREPLVMPAPSVSSVWFPVATLVSPAPPARPAPDRSQADDSRP